MSENKNHQQQTNNAPVMRREMEIMPGSFDMRMKVAQHLAASGLTGTLKTKEQVFLALQMGAELNLTPMAAIRSIHVISGKPTLSADLMIGLIMKHPQFAGISQIDGDKSAKTTIKRKFPGGAVSEFTGEFSIAEAQAAGLITQGGNWQKYPKQMLRHRADTFAARRAFPDLLAGLYTTEEMQSVEQSRTERKTVAQVEQEAAAQPEAPAENPPVETQAEEPAENTQSVEMSPEEDNIRTAEFVFDPEAPGALTPDQKNRKQIFEQIVSQVNQQNAENELRSRGIVSLKQFLDLTMPEAFKFKGEILAAYGKGK